jgi:hypothetical protein
MQLQDLIRGFKKGRIKVIISGDVVFEILIERTDDNFKILIEPKAFDDYVECFGKIEIVVEPTIFSLVSGEKEKHWGDAVKKVEEIVKNLLGSKFYIVELSGDLELRFDLRFDD